MNQGLRGVVLAAVVIAALLGAYLGLDGLTIGEPQAATPGEMRLVVADIAPGAEVPTFRVSEGATGEIRILADRRGTVHIHGFSALTVLSPGTESVLRFVPRGAGAYPVELHENGGEGREIAVVVVGDE